MTRAKPRNLAGARKKGSGSVWDIKAFWPRTAIMTPTKPDMMKISSGTTSAPCSSVRLSRMPNAEATTVTAPRTVSL